MYLRQKGQFYHGALFWRRQLLYLHEKLFATTEVKKVHICKKKKKNRKVAKLGETCHSNEPCRWGFSKGQFALREILFVLQKNLSTRNPFQCERFVWPTKIFASATKLQRYRQLALEVYNFCRTRKSIVPWQIPFNWSSYFVIDTRLNGIMYECFLSERVSKLSNYSLPIFKFLRKKASGKLR